MQRHEIEEKVLERYALQYPDWRDVRVTDIVEDTFGGHIVSIRSRNASEEMCFIYPNGNVHIFGSTEDLIHFLEAQAKAPLLERLFTRPVITGAIFAFLLVAIFAVGFSAKFNSEAFHILGSVVGVAAGFFFGSGNRNT